MSDLCPLPSGSQKLGALFPGFSPRILKGIWRGENKATTLFESKTKANKCIPRRLSLEKREIDY